MKRMRIAHEDGSELDPKRDMRALATRFPGALRELDRLPMSIIDARIQALDEVIEGARHVPEWVHYTCAYHGLLRAFLKIRSLVGDERDASRALELLRTHYVAELDEPTLSEFDSVSLARILIPEEGRANSWAFERIARDFGRTPRDIELAIFNFGVSIAR